MRLKFCHQRTNKAILGVGCIKHGACNYDAAEILFRTDGQGDSRSRMWGLSGTLSQAVFVYFTSICNCNPVFVI